MIAEAADLPDGPRCEARQAARAELRYQRTLTPELKSEGHWMVKQFAKLTLQLEIRATGLATSTRKRCSRARSKISGTVGAADDPGEAKNSVQLSDRTRRRNRRARTRALQQNPPNTKSVREDADDRTTGPRSRR